MNQSPAKKVKALVKSLGTQNRYPSRVKLDHDELVSLLEAVRNDSTLSQREMDALPSIFKTYRIYHDLICLLAQNKVQGGEPIKCNHLIMTRAIETLIKTTIIGTRTLKSMPPILLRPYTETMVSFPVNVPANSSKRNEALKLLTDLRVGSNSEKRSDSATSKVKYDKFTEVAESIMQTIKEHLDLDKMIQDEFPVKSIKYIIRKCVSVEIQNNDKDTIEELTKAAAKNSDKGKPGRMKARLIETIAQRIFSLLGFNKGRF